MNALRKLIDKNNWHYHMLGGYWTRELLDDTVLRQADAELKALLALIADLDRLNKLAREDVTKEPSWALDGIYQQRIDGVLGGGK